MRTACSLPFGGGFLWQRYPGQIPLIWTETPIGQRSLLDRDSPRQRYPLVRDPPPGQRPPWNVDLPDRDWDPPWTDRHLWKHNLCKNFVCGRLYNINCTWFSSTQTSTYNRYSDDIIHCFHMASGLIICLVTISRQHRRKNARIPTLIKYKDGKYKDPGC